jgi:hypothetical protein
VRSDRDVEQPLDENGPETFGCHLGGCGYRSGVKVAVAAARFTIIDTPSKLELVIPARRRWWLLIFLAAWEVGWAVGEVSVIATLAKAHHHSNGIFLAAWLVGWTLGGAAVIVAIAWIVLGKEMVEALAGEFAVRRAVGPFGRTHEYELAAMRNLRVAALEFDPFSPVMAFRWLGISGGRLAFDYGARTFRFAAGVDEAEADAIRSALLDRVPAAHGA